MTTDPSTFSLDAKSPQLQQRLAAFLERHWGRPVRVSGMRRFPTGLSWITIGFTAHLGAGAESQSKELILRIGDPAGLLSPYRAEPEFLALTALSSVPGLPIPQAHACSDDPSILGAPFIVTQWVAGDTPRPFAVDHAARDQAALASLSNDFVDSLSAIHRYDWSAGPLATWSRGVSAADVARRQILVWAEYAGLLDRRAPPQMHYAMRWLEANAPVADRITVVHGDYRVGNFLQQDGRITAILDWEMVHLGDPHEDLAWAGLRTFAAGTSRIGGMIEREAFFERYQAQTGFEIKPKVLRYYEVLGQFKFATTFICGVRRAEAGLTRDVRMAALGLHLAPALLELNRLIGEA